MTVEWNPDNLINLMKGFMKSVALDNDIILPDEEELNRLAQQFLIVFVTSTEQGTSQIWRAS